MDKRLKHLLLAGAITLVLAFTGGCTLPFAHDPASTVCGDQPPESREVDGLYVLPNDGRAPIIEEIEAARCRIDLTIYLISDDQTINALARAQARGVDVRVLIEETPFGGFGQVDTAGMLEAHGIEVRYGPDAFRFTHAKYLVVDNAVGIVTNQNLSVSSFESNREFGVVTTDAGIVRFLSALFESDWSGSQTPDIPDRVLVSPVNAREALPDLLRDADRSISLYIEVIRDDEIIAELQQAADRGVEVRLIVNAPDDDLDLEAMDALAGSGVRIRVAEHIYVHAKALLIDDGVAVIGSHNPTSTSIDDNREVSLLVSDAIALARVEHTFERDWMMSAPWLEEAGSSQKLIQNWSRYPLALDMPMVYGYCVRTVPMGLLQTSQRRDQVSELRGGDAKRFQSTGE